LLTWSWSARREEKTRTGEGNEVRLLRLDEPAQETRGVEVGAQRAAAIRTHIQATRGSAVAEVHVRHLSKLIKNMEQDQAPARRDWEMECVGPERPTWRTLNAPSWRKWRGRGGSFLTRGAAASGSRTVERWRRSWETRQVIRSETRAASNEEVMDPAACARLPVCNSLTAGTSCRFSAFEEDQYDRLTCPLTSSD
jgi:hypothetical protein